MGKKIFSIIGRSLLWILGIALVIIGIGDVVQMAIVGLIMASIPGAALSRRIRERGNDSLNKAQYDYEVSDRGTHYEAQEINKLAEVGKWLLPSSGWRSARSAHRF